MSFYDDSNFMFLAGGAAGKDDKLYNIKPTKGDSYLTVNTDLSSSGNLSESSFSLGWYHGSTQEGDSSIANNQITLLNASGEDLAEVRASNGTNGNVIETGVRYRLEYTVVENNNCDDFATYNASDSPVFTQAPSTVGTHVVFIKNDTNQLVILRNSRENSSIVLKDIKVERDIDFEFVRESNLSATRVNKDGYIEKGNTQLLYNTVWDGITASNTNDSGTGWTKATTQNGSSTATNAQGQITFSAPTTSDRRYLVSPNISTLAIYSQSVFVDAVSGQVKVKEIMRSNSSSNTTKIATLEDGVKVAGESYVTAGKRYTLVYRLTSGSTHFRFGIGTNPVAETNVSVTLSKPQVEYGTASSSYVENKSKTASKGFNILEDEPRFDYIDGGCPFLLVEEERQNLVTNSEYFESGVTLKDVTVSSNAAVSPEGVQNATKVTADTNNVEHFILQGNLSVTSGETYTWSAFVKADGYDYAAVRITAAGSLFNAGSIRVRLKDDDSGDAGVITVDDSTVTGTVTDYGNGWYRISASGAAIATGSGGAVRVQLHDAATGAAAFTGDGTKGILVYGTQFEKGKYPSSYIPSNGSQYTRKQDKPAELTHGIDMGTACSIFFEGKHIAPDAGQISMLRLRIGTDTNNRLLIHGSAAGATTFPLVVQHKESGTSVNATGGTININESFKVLARIDGTTMDVFVNGSLTDTKPITATDIYDKIALYRTPAIDQSGHAVKQAILFDSVLSTNDSEIITGTNYDTFGGMASTLSYTQYE